MKTKMALLIAAIMVISVLSVAFTPVVSEENTSDNITDSNLIEIGNETTVANESLVVESNLTEVNETAIEEQHEKFINPYYEEWKKQYEPPFGHPESAEEMNKWIKERRMPQMPRINISQIREMSYGKGTYFNITGNYSELWNQTQNANHTYAYVVPDLNGDGNPDVLVHTGKYDPLTDTDMEKVIAKKGTDGTHLWEESVSVTGGWCRIDARPAGDLDGDELDDVIVEIDKNVHATDTDMEKVIAKKGTDGTHLWEESVSVTGGWCRIDARPAGDLDGDELDDVIVEIDKNVHATDTDMGKVIAKKGSDGTHLWEESVSVTGGWCRIDARSAGDLDGDELDDVIVEMDKNVHATDTDMEKVIAKKGSDGTHLWEESVSVTGGWCGIYARPAGDLDGDELDDVIVEIDKNVHATDTDMEKVIAKKGTDGTHLWEESVNVTGGWCGIYARPAGDLDGDELDDVIVEIDKNVHATDTDMEKVIAKKGTDGTHLWEESVNVTGGWCGIYARPAGDLDGDELDDVIVEIDKNVYATDTDMEKVIAKKGTDGTHLWEESVSVTGGWCGIYARPAGDLDGDELDDVIVEIDKNVYATDTDMGKVIAKKGSDGTHLWEESVNVTGGWCRIYARPAGDLDGDELTDVIVRTKISKYDPWTEERTYNYTVIANKGSDGTHFWEAESDEWIWVAEHYHEYYHYGYDYLREHELQEEKSGMENFTKPFIPPEKQWMENRNSTKPYVPPIEKKDVDIDVGGGGKPIAMEYYYYPENVTWGYNLNDDEKNDIVLGNTTSVHTITVKDGIIEKFNLTRELPASALAGEEIVVNVTFHPTEDINSVGLHDEAPDDWNVSVSNDWCSPSADFAKATNSTAEYIWYNITNGTEVTASYNVTIPEGIAGEYCFDGNFEYYVGTEGPYTIDIGGDDSIVIIPFPINRTFPEIVTAGDDCNATVVFTNTNVSDFNSIGLHEEAPDDWNVSVNKNWCSPSADAASATDNVAEYIWYGPYSAGEEFSATYSFHVPEDTEEGTYYFSGYLEYYVGSEGPYKVKILEDSEVKVAKFPIYGTTGEVICTALTDVNIFVYDSTGKLVSSTTSDENGDYTVTVKELGDYEIVANKTGFNNVTRNASVTNETGYELNFRGNYGLVPEDPDMSYVLTCINHWLYPPDECGLSMSKVLEVINKWLKWLY